MLPSQTFPIGLIPQACFKVPYLPLGPVTAFSDGWGMASGRCGKSKPWERLMEPVAGQHSRSPFLRKAQGLSLGSLVCCPFDTWIASIQPASRPCLCSLCSHLTFLYVSQPNWVSCSWGKMNRNSTLSFAALCICPDWPLCSGELFFHTFLSRGPPWKLWQIPTFSFPTQAAIPLWIK